MLLITGSSGFIGRSVAAHVAEGGAPALLVPDREALGGAGDLAHRLRAGTVDEVLHLACPSRRAFVDDPEAAARDLERIDAIVIEGLRRCPVVRRVVVVSSAAVYGDRQLPGSRVSESSPLEPVTPYGLAKADQEHRWLSANLAVELCIARPFNVVGPGEPPTLVCAALAARLRQLPEGSSLVVMDSASVRDVLEVRDVGRALLALVAAGQLGPFNVCSGVAVTIAELAQMLVRVSGRVCRLQLDGEGGDSWSVGDPTRLRTVLGWRPRSSLERAVASVWEESGPGGPAPAVAEGQIRAVNESERGPWSSR